MGRTFQKDQPTSTAFGLLQVVAARARGGAASAGFRVAPIPPRAFTRVWRGRGPPTGRGHHSTCHLTRVATRGRQPMGSVSVPERGHNPGRGRSKVGEGLEGLRGPWKIPQAARPETTHDLRAGSLSGVPGSGVGGAWRSENSRTSVKVGSCWDAQSRVGPAHRGLKSVLRLCSHLGPQLPILPSLRP